MSERPEQPPEGRLIALALKRTRLSGRKAAERAGLSEGHWRAIMNGSRSISTGVWVPVHGPAETLARMAQVVGVTPEQLDEAGRGDAAAELRELTAAQPDTEVEADPIKRAQELMRESARLMEEARRILGHATTETDEPDDVAG